MIDRNELKAGDTILVEMQVRYDKGSPNANDVHVQPKGTPLDNASMSVKVEDIKEIIEKPFDWNDVKPGMVFRSSAMNEANNLFAFVGFSPVDLKKHAACERISRNDGKYEQLCWVFNYKQYLTRAPEHDIEVT